VFLGIKHVRTDRNETPQICFSASCVSGVYLMESACGTAAAIQRNAPDVSCMRIMEGTSRKEITRSSL
jgi:hypothetical protein